MGAGLSKARSVGAIFDHHPASPAITEVARRQPDALADLPRVAYFAVAAAHFENFGMLGIVEAFSGQEAFETLAAREEPPRE